MKRFIVAMQAIGILLGVWAVLGLIGLVAGVIPRGQGRPNTPSELPSAGADAGLMAAADAGTMADAATEEPAPVTAEVLDAGAHDAAIESDASALATSRDAGSSSPPTDPTARPRYRVCAAAVQAPSIFAVDVIGDERNELVVGCGEQVHLFAMAPQQVGQALRAVPARVARFELEAPEDGLVTHAAAAASGDVNLDGRADLVLGAWYANADGHPRGGALTWIRGHENGGFDGPIALAPIAALAVAVQDLDGQRGADIIAINRTDVFGRRPSEVWVFTGGAAAARRARLRVAPGADALALVDLDRDGQVDVVAAGRDTRHIVVHFSDGSGRFSDQAEIPVAQASSLAVGDVDGDGAADLLAVAQGLQLIKAGPRDTLDSAPLDAPQDLSEVRVRDLDADGRLDVLALSGRSLVWLRQSDALVFTPEPLLELPRGTTPHRYALGSLDAALGLDAALLVRGVSEDDPWELLIVSNVRSGSARALAPRRTAIADAPLSLRVHLP